MVGGQLAVFGSHDDFIAVHSHPYMYLNLEAIGASRFRVEEVEKFLAQEIMKLPGFTYTLTRSDLLQGRVVGAPIQDQIRRSFHPTRSGNIHMVRGRCPSNKERKGLLASPWISRAPWTSGTWRCGA